ncbi:unnamed protein product, partial [Timema podura]|nr:unnamed protein product [Timema podura]
RLVISNTSETFSLWQRPPVHPLLKMFIFNYTNVDNFKDGIDDKLNVQEVGPYTYSVIAMSVNLVQNASEAFLDELRSRRSKTCSIQVRRRKKVNVPPGKGITIEGVAPRSSEQAHPSTSKQNKSKKRPQKEKKNTGQNKKRLNRTEHFSSSEEEV